MKSLFALTFMYMNIEYRLMNNEVIPPVFCQLPIKYIADDINQCQLPTTDPMHKVLYEGLTAP